MSARVADFVRANRGRLIVLAVGAVALAALLVFLRPEPARLAPVVATRHVKATLSGASGPLGAALADAGLLVASKDGARCAAPPPTVSPGPCGEPLAVALAGLCAWDAASAAPAPIVACNTIDGEAVVISLTIPSVGADTVADQSWRRDLPGPSSLLPPLVAILFALVFRHVIIALGAGVWLGATLAHGSDPFAGIYHAVVDYAVPSITDNWLMLVFTFSLMGMVNVLVRGGGVQGLVNAFSRHAKSARSTQLVTAAMGTVIFFDDYANSEVVGASARPLTDARRISREKLSYIVDSTAAPLAGVAIISTWIGIELQLLSEQLPYIPGYHSAYELFFHLVPYRFYCLFTLALVYLFVLSQRDFGPMLRAERRARKTGAVLREGAQLLAAGGFTSTLPKEGAPLRWANAVVPILVALFAVFGGFFVAAYGPMTAAGEVFDLFSFATWRSAFVHGGDHSTTVLAVAGLSASVAAIAIHAAQGILSLREGLLCWLAGIWAMRLALGILVMAISIRGVTEALDTAPFLVSLLHNVPALWLPLLSFLVAAAVSFSTGTSWGTMGILLPVVVPLVHHQLGLHPEIAAGPITLLAVASVLDGAIFGDHCSPISDTTVLSSLASSADHVDHVRTQIPYASLSMLAAALFGYVGVAWIGWTGIVAYPLGIVALLAFLLIFGRNPDRS